MINHRDSLLIVLGAEKTNMKAQQAVSGESLLPGSVMVPSPSPCGKGQGSSLQCSLKKPGPIQGSVGKT